MCLAGAAVAYLMWNKPQRDVASEEGLTITAAQLVKEYQENESAANTKFLDKAVEVSGTVTEVSQDQEGKTTVMLASDDAFAGVYCTLKEAAILKTGASVTIKGKCNGMLSDVRLSEAVLVSK